MFFSESRASVSRLVSCTGVELEKLLISNKDANFKLQQGTTQTSY